MTRLSDDEAGMLAGASGPAAALSMRVILAAARIQGAGRLVPITSAHVDSCLYHGPSSLDFARALLSGGGRVRVPTTLNVGGLDRSRPDLFAGPASHGEAARQLMDSYVEMGCQPTFTCAPYQLPGRPAAGTDVAWAESNAIVFGNSMIGLRTNRYGDLIDICAAITGRVPHAGLHIPENRAAQALFTVEQDALARVDADLLPALLGHHIGRRTGTLIPVLDGLQAVPITEDWGKAFGAAAASSGGVAMFHILGATPEAPDLATAAQGYNNHLKWNEEAKLKGDLMNAKSRWRSVPVTDIRDRCRALGMREEDVTLIADLVTKAQAGRRLVPQSSYRDFRFDPR